ncbi:MAG: hypothetical protein K1X29_08330 [Bdellovibrionales bacterium]|nr:hypothetical protein [Bdellovibrionales bacterium]
MKNQYLQGENHDDSLLESQQKKFNSELASTSDLTYFVLNFYHFTPIANTRHLHSELQSVGLENHLTGLIILAEEGINGTIAAFTFDSRNAVENWLKKNLQIPESSFKYSESKKALFPNYKVKIRKEIVTLNTPELIPAPQDPSYLTPEQWKAWIEGENKFNLVDARNSYEYKIGAFKGAQDCGTRHFTEFPEAVEEKLQIEKETPLLIYCTGGIRCEKATLELRRRGYREVYQLHGGILKYLEQYPNDQFEGECFVFDERVSLKQDLTPSSRFGFCPHCGDPAETLISCERCETPMRICHNCHGLPVFSKTCSKNCAHHYKLRPWKKAPLTEKNHKHRHNTQVKALQSCKEPIIQR